MPRPKELQTGLRIIWRPPLINELWDRALKALINQGLLEAPDNIVMTVISEAIDMLFFSLIFESDGSMSEEMLNRLSEHLRLSASIRVPEYHKRPRTG